MFMKGEKYGFLSNMRTCAITFNNVVWNCSEQIYQCAKFKGSPDVQRMILACNNGYDAKRIARQHKARIRSDWKDVRVDIMYSITYEKFAQNPNLLELLLAIEGPIKETNVWHDNFWGNCICNESPGKFGSRNTCKGGQDKMGNMLTTIRYIADIGVGMISKHTPSVAVRCPMCKEWHTVNILKHEEFHGDWCPDCNAVS